MSHLQNCRAGISNQNFTRLKSMILRIFVLFCEKNVTPKFLPLATYAGLYLENFMPYFAQSFLLSQIFFRKFLTILTIMVKKSLSLRTSEMQMIRKNWSLDVSSNSLSSSLSALL